MSQRMTLVICLVAPSLVLIVFAGAGILQTKKSSRSSKVLVGSPFRGHEMRASLATQDSKLAAVVTSPGLEGNHATVALAKQNPPGTTTATYTTTETRNTHTVIPWQLIAT